MYPPGPPGNGDTGTDQTHRHEEERHWLAALAAGGPRAQPALKALIGRYRLRFRKYLGSRGFSNEEAEDAMQRTWLEVAAKAHTFDSSRIPEAWLWGFLRNVVRDELRIRALDTRHIVAWTTGEPGEIEAAELQADSDAVHAQGPEHLHKARNLQDCVQHAFAAFKRDHPVVAWWFYLRHVEDWTPQDMARHRQSTVGAANQFLSRHRKSFRKYLAPCLPLLPP